jgi:hypothetical protein
MNGVCSGSGTTTTLIDPRGSITSSISPINKRAFNAGYGSSSINVASGCNASSIQGPDYNSMQKVRSQGGRTARLQKCLSTATSYGDEMSLSMSFRSLSSSTMAHSLLKSRQFSSFGSTTSHFLLSHPHLLTYFLSILLVLIFY